MTIARLPRSLALLAVAAAALFVTQSGCRGAQLRAKQAAAGRWKLARAGVKQRLADQMLSSGQFETAAAQVRQARALDPQNSELTLLEARVSLARGRSDDAEPLLESVKPGSSVAAQALYLRGAIAQQEQHWVRARGLFASAADAEPENLTYFLALVEADLRGGDTVTAQRRIGEKRALYSHDAGFHAAEAECRELAGDWDGACSAWRKTVDATDNVEDQRRLSRCLMAAGRDAEAVDVLRELPTPAAAADRLLLAEALLKLGNAREAEEEALAVVDENEQHAGALALLARIAVLKGDAERGYRLALRILQTNADDVATLELAAGLACHTGRLKSAGEFAARIEHVDPSGSNPVAVAVRRRIDGDRGDNR